MAAVVKKCDCKHEFQDKTYGKENRLHNESEDGKRCTCTVCGKSKQKQNG